MKILNYSYIKVTCCKTNSWKSRGRHSRVFQVFPDISISLKHKQTNTTQENLLDTNTDDASKILDVISWLAITFTRKWGGPSLSGSIQAATYQRLSKCWWVEDEGGVVVMKKITERVRNSHPRLYFHWVMRSFSPALFPSLLQYLWTVSYGRGAVQILGTKGRLCLMVVRANWMRQE